MSRDLSPSYRVALGSGATILALLVWEILGRTAALGEDVLPPFGETLKALSTELSHAAFWSALGDTILQWAAGLACSVVIAVPLGLCLGSGRLRHRTTRSTVDFLRTIPPVMLLPLFVLVWGTGLLMVVLLSVYAAIWPMLTQTISGVRQVEPQTLDTATIFHISPLRKFFQVLLPAVSPFITSGLRVSAVISLFIAIVCELVAGSPGIGQLLAQTQVSGDTASMCGLILVTGVLGLLINTGFRAAENRLLQWHPAYAKGQ